MILLISFVSEILHALIPVPVPASIYGLVILFVLLCTKIVKLEHVEGAGEFLLKIMPMLFIPAGVGVAVAAKLLSSTRLNVDEIIRTVGYENQSHFHQLFRHRFGTTPHRYKQTILQK